MNTLKRVEPLSVAYLFPELDMLLLGYLRKLSPADWERKTVAPQWSVKDVAAHLLDSNIRALSFLRDNQPGETVETPRSYNDLVVFLNELNAEWIRAFRRVSPAVLIDLLEITGKPFCERMQSLDPSAPARFAVAWAGESESANWFHVAREYTEKWHHQQQIRLAAGDDDVLLTERLYLPHLDASMRGLPHHYRTVMAQAGTVIRFTVSGLDNARWYLVRENDRWDLFSDHDGPVSCSVEIDGRIAWRIFTKGISRVEARAHLRIEGEQGLGARVLDMTAVKA